MNKRSGGRKARWVFVCGSGSSGGGTTPGSGQSYTITIGKGGVSGGGQRRVRR